MDRSPKLIPEFRVQDYNKSIDFYISLAGFTIVYDRPEEEFAMLDREGARIMIESISPHTRSWEVGELEPPFGRGVNFQIEVADVESLYASFKDNAYPIFFEMEEKWYRRGEGEVGNRQFLVQDPDGYLLRFFEDLGSRPRRRDLE